MKWLRSREKVPGSLAGPRAPDWKETPVLFLFDPCSSPCCCSMCSHQPLLPKLLSQLWISASSSEINSVSILCYPLLPVCFLLVSLSLHRLWLSRASSLLLPPIGGEKNCSLAEPFPGPFQSWLTFPLAWEPQSSGDLVPLLLKGRMHFKRQSGSSANWS